MLRPAVLAAATWVVVILRLGWSPSLVPELALVTGLVPLALADRASLRLPRRLVYATGAAVAVGVVVAAMATGDGHRAVVAVACAAAELAVFFALHLVNPSGLGFGDVRLSPVLGLALGWLGIRTVVAGVLLAFVCAAVFGVALLATKRGTRKSELPFGVFLALGAVLAIVVG